MALLKKALDWIKKPSPADRRKSDPKPEASVKATSLKSKAAGSLKVAGPLQAASNKLNVAGKK